MKTVIPWIITVLALVVGWFIYDSGRRQSEQITTLEAQVAELDEVRAELAEVRQNLVDPEELKRLQKDSQDAMRLRNEIGQLRDQKSAIEQQARRAQAEAEQAEARAQAAQSQVETLNQQQQEAAATMTPQEQAFAARYGLTADGVQLAMTCINQLFQIEGASQQWALEYGQPGTAIPTAEQVGIYIRDGFPECPAGGVYTLRTVAEGPACNQPGHLLVK